jgi:uncharacterized protein with NAD-binding domain and iron-sulfur cluster
MARQERPGYIYSGGNVLMHSPLSLGQSEMYGFFVRGDRMKLQRSVDETLNTAAAGRMHFKVLSPFVLLTFTKVGHAQSTHPGDAAKGWGIETDIVTWVMVGQVLPGQAKVNHVYVWPCHIFVDDTMALINGRELYGYPKYGCEYTMPAPGEAPRSFSLAAKGFQPFSPETQLALHPLLAVEATDTSRPHQPLRGWEGFVQQLVELLASETDALDLDAAGWEQVAQAFLKPQLDQIFLKQFPDSAGEKAVYQGIVSAPAVVNKVHSVELLGWQYQLTLQPFASFPLADTLGLAPGAQPAILPFHLTMDFEVTQGEELVDNSTIAPQKIAILGGGVGAMTAAFWLTDQPGWQNRYEITLYQMGWRVGGKGASGRNAALGQRIEEHGLHIWFGFYDNAFNTIQKAYDLLQRPPGAPLASWTDAFKPQHFITLTEFVQGQWKTWPIDTPLKSGTPGQDTESVGPWAMASTLYAWIQSWLGQLKDAAAFSEPQPLTPPGQEHEGWLHGLARHVEQDVEHLAADVEHAAQALVQFSQALAEDARSHDAEHHELMHAALQSVRGWLHEAVAAEGAGDDLRRLYIVIDLACTALIGMFEDGVFTRGFDVINDVDFYAWLTKHGANEKLTVHSAPVRGFYDLVFAYENGDFERPNIEAGTMLRGMLRVAVAYHGGIMWEMQAGMGDTVFTPLYQVLKSRGVQFRFFHKVEALVPAAEGSNLVEQIRLTQQVSVSSGPDHYHPLVNVKGLACWPSEPDYAQIVPEQAALLQQHDVNLESNWSNWPQLYEQHFGQPLPTQTLQRGVDFDLVVFGISADGVKDLCPQLVARSPALQAMSEKVRTVATQAYQVWIDCDLEAMGWTSFGANRQEPVLSAFAEPFDTWAPMDQLLQREAWPPAQTQPKNVSYFCSALPINDYPPYSDHGFPARCAAAVKQSAINQLETQIGALWPGVVGSTGFRWACLIDPEQGQGEQRFDRQYWRANVDPSERYVLSVVGSSAYRLATDGAGFANLYLTGDWIRTGLNAGCVEAAVMAGMQTSRAISGWPQVIRGESDF